MTYPNPSQAAPGRKHRLPTRSQQQGIALFMVLMVSLIVTLLSISLASSMVNETRTTLTGRDQAIARQAAEAALRDAELDIRCLGATTTAGVQTFVFNSYGGGTSGNPRQHCLTDPSLGAAEGIGQLGIAGATTCNAGMILAPTSTPNNANGTTYSTTDYNACNTAFGSITGQAPFAIVGASVAAQPRYTIELFSFENGHTGQGTPLYRIRARGYGRNIATVVDLEEVFRPW